MTDETKKNTAEAEFAEAIEQAFGGFSTPGKVEFVADGASVMKQLEEFGADAVIAIKSSEGGNAAKIVIATLKPGIDPVVAETLDAFRTGMRDQHIRTRIQNGEDPKAVIAEVLGLEPSQVKERGEADDTEVAPEHSDEKVPPKNKLH